MMDTWSRLAGDIFLDWLGPRSGSRWADVDCGNAPAEIDGIDPSDAQLAYARARPAAAKARFHHGDAMALPFADNSFDAATIALVIFFVPEPAKGIAETRAW